MLTRPVTRGKTFHLSMCKMWLLDRWSLNCPFQNECYTRLSLCVQILICKSVFHTVNHNAQSLAAVCFRISTYPSPHTFIIYKHTHTHTHSPLSSSFQSFSGWSLSSLTWPTIIYPLPTSLVSSLAIPPSLMPSEPIIPSKWVFWHRSLPLNVILSLWKKSSTFFPPSKLFSQGPVKFWGKPSLTPPLLPPP